MQKKKKEDAKPVKKTGKKKAPSKTTKKDPRSNNSARQKKEPKYDEVDVLKAIKGCRTIISTVAKRLGCEWYTAQRYINRWESTKQAYEDEKQHSLDMAESALFKNIDDGDVGAIKYFLTKKAKDRGYGDEENGIEDQENTNDNVFRIVDTSPLRACDTGEFDDE